RGDGGQGPGGDDPPHRRAGRGGRDHRRGRRTSGTCLGGGQAGIRADRRPRRSGRRPFGCARGGPPEGGLGRSGTRRRLDLRGGRGAAGSQGRRRTLTSHRLPVPLPAMSRESTFIMVKLDGVRRGLIGDRKSTRLNSSHVKISYAVFCLKKKNSTRVEPPDA